MRIKISLAVLLLCVVWGGYAQESYVLSDKSSLKIEGISTLHDWVVTAHSLKGNIQVLEAQPTSLRVVVDAPQIKSERGATMDKKMHAALKVDEHPEISFQLENIQKQEASGMFVLKGTLSIAGVSQKLDIISEVKQVGRAYTLKGSKEIKLQDFDFL